MFIHHEWENGTGEIEIWQDGVKKQTVNRTMVQLADNPIRFYVKMNTGQLNEVEYYCGIDNPGCYIKVNTHDQREMASQPDPEELPKFLRGETADYFGGPKWSTTYTLFAGTYHEPVAVNITYDRKTKFFTMVCGKKRERVTKVTTEMLRNGESIKMIENVWNMKLQAWLNKEGNSFILNLNNESVLSLMRYDPADEDNEDESSESVTISSKFFQVNDKAILQQDLGKSFRGLENTIERQLEEAKELTAEKIEIEDLVCNGSNFVKIIEFLNQKIQVLNENSLQELSLIGLPRDLVIKDWNLIERFARSCQNV